MFYQLNNADQVSTIKLMDICDLSEADHDLTILIGHDSKVEKQHLVRDLISEIVFNHDPDCSEPDEVSCVEQAIILFLDLAAKYIKNGDTLPTETVGDLFLMVGATHEDNTYWAELIDGNLATAKRSLASVSGEASNVTTAIFRAVIATAYDFYMVE